MELEEYERLFKKSMVVSINWDRAYKEEWNVEQRVISSRAELGKIYLPWTKDGIVGDKGKRIQLNKLNREITYVGKKYREKIFNFAAAFEKEPESICFLIPTVKGEIGSVLLDCSHKCSALMISRCDFSVLVCELLSPSPVWMIT